METLTVTKVNEVMILVGNDPERLVPIKPICKALGIDYSSQLSKLKEDRHLNSVMVLSTTTGADGPISVL